MFDARLFDAHLLDAHLLDTFHPEARQFSSPTTARSATLSDESVQPISFGRGGFARITRALRGAVCLLVGMLLGGALLAGGAGAQTAHFSSFLETTSDTPVNPVGIAVDGHGNVFVSDTGGTCSGVGELVAVNGLASISTAITCLPVPSTYTSLGASSQRGVAVDGQGNVYVVATNMFYEIALDSTGKISSSSVATLINTGTGGHQFCAVAAGISSSVYILDCGTDTLWSHTSGSANLNPVAQGFSAPVSVAIDASGNAFVVDQGGSAVYEVPAGSSAVAASSLTPLAAPTAGWKTPVGVAVDGGGNVYVGSKVGGVVYKIVASGGVVSASSVVKMLAAISNITSLAFSGNGNLYIGDNETSSKIYHISTQIVNLGSVAVGSSLTSGLLSFQFDGAGAIAAPQVLTQGATGLDFTDAGGGSCTSNNGVSNPYTTYSSCTVNIKFTPTAPGVRTGVVELVSSTGTVIAKAWLTGTGLGAQMNVDPATSTKYTQTDSGNPLVYPVSVSVDEAGDLFVTDDQNHALYELASGSSTFTTINSTAFSSPYATALDAAGNLYLADSGKTAIYQFANTNTVGGFTDAGNAYSALFPTTTTFGGSTLTSPQGLAVGPDGVLYIADVVSPSSGRVVSYNLTTGVTAVRASGLVAPHGIAFDASGNLYVADQSSGSILEYSGSGSTVSQTYSLTGISAGFSPWGIAVDPSGSLLVGDTASASGKIVRIPNENGKLTVADATTLETDYYSAFGIALDAVGNLYAADEAYGVVYRYARTQASLSFGSVNDGSSSTTKTVTLESTGNVAVSSFVPTLSNLSFTRANTCPPSSLWGSCTATLGFSPSVTDSGAVTGSLSIGPSTSSTWVTIALSGTAVKPTVATPTFSVAAGTYLTMQSVALSDTTSGAKIYYTTDNTTPTSGSTPYTIGTPISVASSETINAIAVATNYTNSAVVSNTYYINPNAIEPTVALAALPANTSPSGSTVYLTATVSGISGTVANGDTVIFYDGSTEVTSATLTNNVATVGVTLPAGVNSLTAYYGGHGSTYLSSTSPVLSYTVSVPSTTTLALSSTVSGVTTPLSSGGSLAYGKPLTLTATVLNGTSPVPVGTVNFCNALATYCSDINRIGTAQLNSAGVASIRFYPGVGSYSYYAVYAGASNSVTSYYGGTSSTQSLTVTAPTTLEATTTTLVNTTGGTTPPYTVTATVTANGPSATSLNGTAVSFLDASNNNDLLTTANLSGDVQTTGFRDPYTTDPTVGLSGAHNSVVLGDFDNDGIKDMVVSSYVDSSQASQVTLFRGNGDGTFTQQGAAIPTDTGVGKIVVGDFNGDGKLDFAVVTASGVDVFLNTGNWTFSKAAYTLSTFGTGFTSIVVGDFNGDGNLDLALTFSDDIVNTVAILLGNGDGTFTVEAGRPTITGLPRDIAVGDFNEDGVLDLVVVDEAHNKVDVLLGAGDGTFTAASGSPYTVGNYPMSVAVGDFNGDGHLDLAVANYLGNSISILQGAGTGSFAAASYSPITVSSPNSIAIGDFNGDRVADLAVYTPYQLVPLVGTGSGFTVLTPISLPAMSLYPLSVAEIAVGDLNGDGLSDFVAVNSSDTATIELGQFTQTATAATSITSSTPNILTGSNNVYASYSGTTTYAASHSSNVALQMATATTLSLSTSATAANSGSSVTLTATLKPTASVATAAGELVKFYINGSTTAFATAALNASGVATLNTITLPTGTDNITASYAGDATLGASSTASAVTVTVAGTATQIVKVSGTGQSAAVGAAFANALVVEVEDANGIAVPGATVSFAAPTTGASATFSSPSAVTGSTGSTVGIASVNATANATAGSYSVTASTGGINTTFSLTNNLVLTTASLSSGTVGLAYSQPLSVNGAVGSVIYSITSGALPAGITLNAGALSGTPTAGGTFSNITIKATDGAGNTASQTYSLTIASPTITIQTGNPPAGTYGVAYSQTIPASSISGGTAPYTYALASGSTLPPGLALSTSGTLSGTPTKAGTYTFTAVATDHSTGTGPYTGSQSYTLIINQATLTATPTANSKTYGTANPTFSGTITGAVTGDGITATYASGATTTTAVGVYSTGTNAIAATLVDPNSKLTNYTVTYNLGTLTINQAAPNLSFATIPAETYGNAPFTVSATSASTSAVTYSVGTGSPATVNATTGLVTLTGVGSVTLNASQAATSNYSAATATVTFNVAQGTPNLSFATIPAETYGNAPFTVSATSASTGAVTYSVGTGSPATVNATTGLVTLTGAGSVTLNASQVATTNYLAATATVTFNVATAAQTISFTQPTSPVTYGVSPITLVASGGGSTSSVTFSVTGPASLNGSTLTITGAGTVVVTASQAATTNYAAATPVSRTIVVNQATPLVSVNSSPSTIFVRNAVTLTATVASVACSPNGTVTGTGYTAFCTPSGSVTFLSGQTALATVPLNNGGAQLTTSTLPIGADSITVTYSGDANFLPVSSGATSNSSVTVEDFTIVTGSSTGGITLTALPSSGLTYNFSITPANGATTFPGEIALTLSGLPAGATYSFSPATIAAGSGTTNVALTIQLPQEVSLLQPKTPTTVPLASRLAPLSLALLLLPFAGRMRKRGKGMMSKQMGRLFSILLLLSAGMIAMAGISGCGSSTTGYFDQVPKSYPLTVTATSGGLSHSFNITLNVE